MRRSLIARFFTVLLSMSSLGPIAMAAAQDEKDTPSQKMKEAVDKLGKAPGILGKTVEGLIERGKAKLQGASGANAPEKKPDGDNLAIPTKKAEPQAAPRYSSTGKRDPFRPSGLKAKGSLRIREGASPLERKDLGQFKLVGIIWDVKEPRAMVEDTDGLGYTIKVGTQIGDKDGKVKLIKPTEVVVEEVNIDFYGAKRTYQRSIRLPND